MERFNAAEERRQVLRRQEEQTQARRARIRIERDRIKERTDPSNYFEPGMTLADAVLLDRDRLRMYHELHPEILSRVSGPDLIHLLNALEKSSEKLRHNDFLVNNMCRSAKKNLKQYEDAHREDLAE
jgi:hypothetical protein